MKSLEEKRDDACWKRWEGSGFRIRGRPKPGGQMVLQGDRRKEEKLGENADVFVFGEGS